MRRRAGLACAGAGTSRVDVTASRPRLPQGAMAQFGSVSSAFSKAGDSLLMVVAEAQVEATVEPTLGVRRGGGHLPGVGAEIIRIVHVASAPIFDEVARR